MGAFLREDGMDSSLYQVSHRNPKHNGVNVRYFFGIFLEL